MRDPARVFRVTGAVLLIAGMALGLTTGAGLCAGSVLCQLRQPQRRPDCLRRTPPKTGDDTTLLAVLAATAGLVLVGVVFGPRRRHQSA